MAAALEAGADDLRTMAITGSHVGSRPSSGADAVKGSASNRRRGDRVPAQNYVKPKASRAADGQLMDAIEDSRTPRRSGRTPTSKRGYRGVVA